jgi:hypothetical protein
MRTRLLRGVPRSALGALNGGSALLRPPASGPTTVLGACYALLPRRRIADGHRTFWGSADDKKKEMSTIQVQIQRAAEQEKSRERQLGCAIADWRRAHPGEDPSGEELRQISSLLDHKIQMHTTQHNGASPDDDVARLWFNQDSANQDSANQDSATAGPGQAIGPDPTPGDALESHWMSEASSGTLVLGAQAHPSTEQGWSEMDQQKTRRWWAGR